MLVCAAARSPGAQVALGLKAGVTLEEFEAGNRREACRRTAELGGCSSAGDMIYVAAGTVHTIGGGMVLVETQQTSDITYRLYDYGRGRELHIAEGLAATKLQTNAGKVVPRGNDDPNVLVRSPFFEVEKIKLREPLHADGRRRRRRTSWSPSTARESWSRRAWSPSASLPGEAVVIPAACAGVHGASAVGAGNHANVAAAGSSAGAGRQSCKRRSQRVIID